MTGYTSLHLNEAQLTGTRHVALNVIPEFLGLAISRIKAQTAFDLHDDGAGPRRTGLRIGWRDRNGGRLPLHGQEQAHRHHQHTTQDHRRQWRNLRLQFQVFETLLQSALKQIGPFACLT